MLFQYLNLIIIFCLQISCIYNQLIANKQKQQMYSNLRQSNTIQHIRMIDEFNQLRTNPEKIVSILNKRKNNFSKQDELLYFSPFHPNRAIKTKQGIKPVNMLIGQLYSQDPLPELLQNQQLSIFAQELAHSLKNKEINQIFLTTDMANFIRNSLNESTKYVFDQQVQCLIGVSFEEEYEPLVSLLIDDGDQKKRNRNILLTKSMKYIGSGLVNLDIYPELTVGVYLLAQNIELKQQ